MGDDKWQQDPQYKPGVDEAGQQVGQVDVVENVLAAMPFGGLHVNLFGTTNFENADLNAMIDLVEHARPEHLELASKALWDAHKSISEAAKELRAHIGATEWKGAAATAFSKWGNGLADWSDDIAAFADTAATQISAAGMGLATVSKSMPPRDTRPADERHAPDKLPKAKQVDSDPDFVLAKKVEKDRQEAINQMNKLASYYAVSAGHLKTQDGPQPYRAMPPVGMPKPIQSSRDNAVTGSGGTAAGHLGTVRTGGDLGHHTVAPATGTETTGHVPPVREVHEPGTTPGHHVGTEIDTVGTLPPPTTPTAPHAPTPTPPASGGGQTLPLPTGPVPPPIAPTTGRSYGPLGRPPLSGQGRTGSTVTPSSRTPQGPAGRATGSGRVPQGPLGQAARATAAGRTPQAGQTPVRGTAQQAGRAPMGRGVTGGTPRAAATPGGRTGATGPVNAARNGVSGGKPVTGRTSGAAAGPRVPRGTVVGAEEQTVSTPAKGGLGRRGVIGAPSEAATEAVPRSADNPRSVIGTPQNEAAAGTRGTARGIGAAGLGRGAESDRQARNSGTNGAGAPGEGEERGRTKRQRRNASPKSD
ncbi:hypothetical protein [Streptomyces collinus]|uniref:hypothetical protein n=1 Tax=Streptomyces collinus TaxID=42684 RepID=UPI003829DC12